jgi:hypothetical protein
LPGCLAFVVASRPQTKIITALGLTIYGNMGATSAMARKKKTKRFRAVTAVKELARERVGTPPSAKVLIEKKKKPEKHKPTLGKLLGEE